MAMGSETPSERKLARRISDEPFDAANDSMSTLDFNTQASMFESLASLEYSVESEAVRKLPAPDAPPQPPPPPPPDSPPSYTPYARGTPHFRSKQVSLPRKGAHSPTPKKKSNGSLDSSFHSPSRSPRSRMRNARSRSLRSFGLGLSRRNSSRRVLQVNTDPVSILRRGKFSQATNNGCLSPSSLHETPLTEDKETISGPWARMKRVTFYFPDDASIASSFGTEESLQLDDAAFLDVRGGVLWQHDEGSKEISIRDGLPFLDLEGEEYDDLLNDLGCDGENDEGFSNGFNGVGEQALHGSFGSLDNEDPVLEAHEEGIEECQQRSGGENKRGDPGSHTFERRLDLSSLQSTISATPGLGVVCDASLASQASSVSPTGVEDFPTSGSHDALEKRTQVPNLVVPSVK